MDLGQQLQLQQQINDLIKERESLLKKQAKLFANQSKISERMCKALSNCPPSDTTNRVKEMRDGLEDAAKQANKTKDEMDDIADSAEEAAEQSSGLGSSIAGVVTGAAGLLGVSSIFGKIGGAIQGVIGFLGSAVRGIVTFGASLLMLPLKILGGLIEFAGSRPAVTDLREAYEEVRETFGSLSKKEGKAMIGVVKQARKESKNLAGTGLSLGQVFGFGQKGLASILRYNVETGIELGDTYGKLAHLFEGPTSTAIGAYRKILGLTAHQQAMMMKTSFYMGRDVVKDMEKISHGAHAMYTEFGISTKRIGKALGEMAEDFLHFGHMSTETQVAVAAHAKKMGVSIKALAGIMDKFLDFEDAASSVANLSAAMGVQLDLQKLMKAENPSKIIEEYRRAFFAAGKDISNMNFHQKAFIQQQLGLDDATMMSIFSLENQGKSYDELKKGAEAAMSPQEQTVNILRELRDEIKKLVHAGGPLKSFLEAMQEGFLQGITWSRPFMKLMNNFRGALHRTRRAFREIGKDFVEFFPGIKKMLDGLSQMFDKNRFQKQLLDPIKKAFKEFFKAIKDGPEGVKSFLSSISDTFMKWLKGGTGGAGDVLGGFGEFMTAIKNIFIGLAQIAAEALTKGIRWLTAWIQNPSAGPFSELWEATKEMFGAIWSQLAESLGPSFYELGVALGELWDVVFPMLQNKWEEYAPKIQAWFGEIITSLWDNEYVRYAVYALGAGIALMLAPILIPAIMGIGRLIGGLVSGIGGMFDWASSAGGAADAAGAGQTWSQLGKQLAGQAANLVMIGAFLYAMTTYVMIPLIDAIDGANNLTPEKVTAFSLLMATMLAGGMAAAMAAAWVGKFPLKETATGMVLLGLFMLAIGGIGRAIVWMLDEVSVERLEATGKFMTGLGVMLGVMALVIPVAAMVGALAVASFGIGAGIIAVGFAAIAGFVGILISELVPALESIKNVSNKIGDPNKFKLVTEAVSSMLNSVGGIIQGVGTMIQAAKPSAMSGDKVETFAGNMAQVHILIDKLLQNGLVSFVDKMVQLAKLPDISEEGAQVATALAGVMSAVADTVGSLGASAADATILKAAADNWGEDMKEMGDVVSEIKETSAHIINSIIVQMGLFVKQITHATAGKDFSKIGPFMESIGPIFQGLSSILNTMGEFAEPLIDDLEHYQKSRSGARLKEAMREEGMDLVEHLNKDSVFYTVVKDLGTVVNDIANDLQPMMKTIGQSDVSPEVWKAGSKMFLATLEVITMIGKMGSDGIELATKFLSKKVSYDVNVRRFQHALDQQTTFVGGVVDSVVGALPRIRRLVVGLLGMVGSDVFKDPNTIIKRLDVVKSVMSIVGSIGEVFGDPKGPFAGSGPTMDVVAIQARLIGKTTGGPLEKTITAITNFMEKFGGSGGLLNRMFKSVGSIKIGKKQKWNLQVMASAFKDLAPVIDGITTLSSAFGSGGKTDPFTEADLIRDFVTAFFVPYGVMNNSSVEYLLGSIAAMKLPKGLGKVAEQLETGISDATQIGKNFVTLGKVLSKVGSDVSDDALVAIDEVVARIAELDDMFAQVENHTFGVALDNFANAVATGANRYMIDVGKGSFKFNLHITVNMDKINTMAFLSGKKPEEVREEDNLRLVPGPRV